MCYALISLTSRQDGAGVATGAAGRDTGQYDVPGSPAGAFHAGRAVRG